MGSTSAQLTASVFDNVFRIWHCVSIAYRSYWLVLVYRIVEVDGAAAGCSRERTEEAASCCFCRWCWWCRTASFSCLVQCAVFPASSSFPDIADLCYSCVWRVQTGRRSAGAAASNHRSAGRADCRRQSKDLSAAAAAATAPRNSRQPNFHSALESGSRRTYHLTKKKSPERRIRQITESR